MSYEVKVYIGRTTNVTERKSRKMRHFFEPYVMVDLSSVGGSVYDLSKRTDGTPVFIYGLDGNKAYHEDRYGKELTTQDPELLLEALKSDIGDDKGILRQKNIALDMVKSALKQYGAEVLDVVLYGY